MIEVALVSEEIHEVHIFRGGALELSWHDINTSLTFFWLKRVIISLCIFLFDLPYFACFALE